MPSEELVVVSKGHEPTGYYVPERTNDNSMSSILLTLGSSPKFHSTFCITVQEGGENWENGLNLLNTLSLLDLHSM